MIKQFSENGPVGVLKPCCTTAGDHTRALTAPHPIKPTSPRCPSAWQPNPDRRSTYRSGNSVQITGTSSVALVLAVHPSLPVHDVTELIEYAKKNPGKLAYASAGIGSSHHICGELIKQKVGIDMVHVPYRGGALAMQDLLAGNVKVGFSTLPVALPQAQAGSIRIIAAAEKTRLPELPDTPTIDETVSGVINVGWNGLLAPAGTPAPIIDKLNALAVAALKTPDIIAKMKLQGLHTMSSTPVEFATLIASEVDHWAKVIPSIGIQAE